MCDFTFPDMQALRDLYADGCKIYVEVMDGGLYAVKAVDVKARVLRLHGYTKDVPYTAEHIARLVIQPLLHQP